MGLASQLQWRHVRAASPRDGDDDGALSIVKQGEANEQSYEWGHRPQDLYQRVYCPPEHLHTAEEKAQRDGDDCGDEESGEHAAQTGHQVPEDSDAAPGP